MLFLDTWFWGFAAVVLPAHRSFKYRVGVSFRPLGAGGCIQMLRLDEYGKLASAIARREEEKKTTKKAA